MLFLAHWMDYPPAGIRFGAALPPLPNGTVAARRWERSDAWTFGAGGLMTSEIAERGEPVPPGLGL